MAPFPPIEVVRWRCKLRDERTGRPKVNPETGRTLYDPEEHLFTLDNRRLYCLQLAATRVWPELCTIDVAELPSGPPELMREMKKFKTVDSGKSILIVSRQDRVPFIRWSWRVKLKVSDGAGSNTASGYERRGGKGGTKAAPGSKGRPKAARNAPHDVTIPQPLPSASSGEAPGPKAGALLLSILKDGNAPPASDESADGQAKGAFLLGLLKGAPGQPAKAAEPPTAAQVRKWLGTGSSANWWESGESWQASSQSTQHGSGKGNHWAERGRY